MAIKNRVISATEKEQLRQKLNRRRKIVKAISKLTWLLVFAASIGIYYVVNSFGVVPENLMKYLRIGLIVFNVFFAIFAWLPAVNNTNKIIQSSICGLLAAALCAGIIILPGYKGKLQKMFNEVPSEGTMNICAYVLKDNSNLKDIESLAGRMVGVQNELDVEYQNWAVATINKEIDGPDIRTSGFDDIYSAVDALLAGSVDCILLNEEYAKIIEENEDYKDFNSKVRTLYTCAQKIDLKVDTKVVENMTKEPFVIGIIGQDDWLISGIEKTSGYRSDVNIMVFVNPNTKQVLMLTVPRDAHVPLYGSRNKMDKLTHSPFVLGIQGWVDTMSAYFGVDINYYLRVNFASLLDIVDAIGGVDINNPYTFTSDVYFDYFKNDNVNKAQYKSIEFPEGEIHLDGQMALSYCRERHNVKGGDMGRNKHQAIVMKAMIDKICSPSIITNANKLLDAVTGKFASNITFEEVTALVKYQLEGMYDWDLQSYSLSGRTGAGSSYMMGGRDLSMVFVSDASLNKAKTYIHQLLNGEIVKVED